MARPLLTLGGAKVSTDPLTAHDRARLMAAPRPRRLPLAPHAAPGRNDVVLADAAREVDRQARPIYAVWEITLACDLACRHCGSRAGRARPDELSTEECLDLVRQMAALGVREVTLIGGEAYLREDWLEIVRGDRARGHDADDDHRRSRHRRCARRRRQAGRPSQRERVARGLRGHPRPAARCRRLVRVRARGDGAPARCCRFRSRPTRRSIGSRCRSYRRVLEMMGEQGAHSWQMQLTVPMGRAADEPEVLLQPYELLELFPLLAQLRARCDELGVRMLPGNNIGYFGPYEAALREHMPRRPRRFVSARRSSRSASRPTARSRAARRCRREAWSGGNIREQLAARHLGARRAAALHARSHRRRPVGLLHAAATTPTCAAPAAPGPATCSSAARATTRTATIARSSISARASASAWCCATCPRVCHSITVASKRSWRTSAAQHTQRRESDDAFEIV